MSSIASIASIGSIGSAINQEVLAACYSKQVEIFKMSSAGIVLRY